MPVSDGPVPNPNFPVITAGVKRIDDLLPEEISIQTFLTQLQTDGKTDGVRTADPIPGSTGSVIYRNWLDTASANEWITFLLGLEDPDIVSVTIYTQ